MRGTETVCEYRTGERRTDSKPWDQNQRCHSFNFNSLHCAYPYTKIITSKLGHIEFCKTIREMAEYYKWKRIGKKLH